MTFETYRPIEQYAINNIKQDYPSCFNGMVRVKRYKVTIEGIEEPKEVLCERLEKLCTAQSGSSGPPDHYD